MYNKQIAEELNLARNEGRVNQDDFVNIVKKTGKKKINSITRNKKDKVLSETTLDLVKKGETLNEALRRPLDIRSGAKHDLPTMSTLGNPSV